MNEVKNTEVSIANLLSSHGDNSSDHLIIHLIFKLFDYNCSIALCCNDSSVMMVEISKSLKYILMTSSLLYYIFLNTPLLKRNAFNIK